jgi:hypothetical protein
MHFTTPEQSWAVTLWAAHTWAVDAFDISPRLAIRAPTRGSGKTRLLEVLAQVCKDAHLIVGPSEAVIYRMIAAGPPTILLDEADRLFEKRAEDVAGIVQMLNTGHARGTTVPRVLNPHTNALRFWPAYAAVALAGIGTLWPDTIMDRAILITLERKTPTETVSPLRREHQWLSKGIGEEVGALIRAAVDAGLPKITRMPDLGSDRAQDNWLALFQIAYLAGRHWPERAVQAALRLSAAGIVAVEDDRPEIMALRDVRATFLAMGDPEFVSSYSLLDALLNRTASPWAAMDWHYDRALTAARLATYLRTFGVTPEQPGHRGSAGYWLSQVDRAWQRVGQGRSLVGIIDAEDDDG